MIIEVSDICRDFNYYEKTAGFRGSFHNIFNRKKHIRRAVDKVSFTIDKGEIVGFIGPNGAGKTTTIKMLSGILHPTSGSALVNGYIPWERKNEYKRSIGLVAGQKSQLIPDLPALETFYINKYIYKIPDDEYKKTVDELASMLEVEEFLSIQTRKLSLGQRMKMEIIAAILHKPTIIFLDEPTIGLDIMSQNTIREYLNKYNKQTGATILLTSHYTKDIEEMCERTIIINHGKKVYDGTVDDLKKFEKNVKIVNLTFSEVFSKECFASFGKILSAEDNHIKIELENENINEKLAKILAIHDVVDFTVEDLPLEKSLESIFRETVE